MNKIVEKNHLIDSTSKNDFTFKNSFFSFFKFQKPLWWIRMTTFEYLPTWLVYLPLMPYWGWLALKARSFTYFSAVNPRIPLGGFFGESKIDILNQIPSDYVPKTLFFEQNTPFQNIQLQISENSLSFPLIAKPNVGERGYKVALLENFDQLSAYNQEVKADFLIQEYIDYPIELGVLYYRLPNEDTGKISSVVIKEFLTVRGDGKSTIAELMAKDTRFRFQILRFQQEKPNEISKILAVNETYQLEPIGNHCRGTKFINGNYLINAQLNEVFNQIALQISDFHYGRFDLRVRTWEDLYKGSHIKILELNGISSDPGHIYDPSTSVWKALRDIAHHFYIIYKIARINHRRGVRYSSLYLLLSTIKKHFYEKSI